MKKNVLLISACLLILAFMPATVHSQGFLKKLKQKVENAVIGTDESQENKYEVKEEEEPESRGTLTPTDKIPKLRTATSSWDEMIQPSKASTVKALLNELPALPSIPEMVTPTEEARANYYRKIVAVDMRVAELDEQYTCSDEEMIASREKLYKDMADAIGLTAEEIKRLEDPNLPEAEQKRLAEKVTNSLIAKPEMDRMAAMGAELEKREKAKGGELSDEEMMQFMAENPDIMNDMLAIATKGAEASAKMRTVNARLDRMNQQLQRVSEKQKQLAKKQGAIIDYEEVAKDYENKLKKIYEQIFATEDRKEVDRLYAQADELMKNYRTRAAKLWRNSLQTQLDNAKALLPELESVYKEMAKEELIPACAVNRASYNLVTNFTDILHQAYSDFPQPSVLPVQMEPILKLKEHEYLWGAESGFASSVTDFLTNSRIVVYNDEENARYVYENGQRRKLTDKDPRDLQPKTPRVTPQYNTWTSESGVRKVTYTRDGSVTLHDGTSFYPLAFQQLDNKLVWVIAQKNSIIKCTYKL